MTDNLKSQLILSESDIEEKIRQIASLIREKTGESRLSFVGIRKRGVPLAQRVLSLLHDAKPEIPLGTLDISLYRDDLDNLGTNPAIESSDIPFEVDGAHIILFDDVLFTGRTVRAALGNLIDYGRPAKIELAVLVDRGNRELPIQADYCGCEVQTTKDEYIRARFREMDDEEGIWLLK